MPIKITGTKEVIRLLSVNIEGAVKDIVDEVAVEHEGIATENLSSRIYGQPESPNYRRTGRALGGRIIKEEGPDKTSVVFNSRLKGARKNYTPFLNRNARIRKLNTKFWDDAVEETRQKAPKIAKEVLKKELKKKT